MESKELWEHALETHNDFVNALNITSSSTSQLTSTQYDLGSGVSIADMGNMAAAVLAPHTPGGAAGQSVSAQGTYAMGIYTSLQADSPVASTFGFLGSTGLFIADKADIVMKTCTFSSGMRGAIVASAIYAGLKGAQLIRQNAQNEESQLYDDFQADSFRAKIYRREKLIDMVESWRDFHVAKTTNTLIMGVDAYSKYCCCVNQYKNNN